MTNNEAFDDDDIERSYVLTCFNHPTEVFFIRTDDSPRGRRTEAEHVVFEKASTDGRSVLAARLLKKNCIFNGYA